MITQLESDFKSLQRMIPHSESKYATHYLHRYPAKFLPHFPRIFIKHFLSGNKNELILDPMCGSGTTLVESCLADKKCIGIEIDPTGHLIAQVATTPLNINITRKYATKLISRIESGLKYNIHKRIPLPSEHEFPNASLWFRKDVLREIIFIKELLNNSKLNENCRNFFKLSLSSIIRDISNADPRDIFPQRDQSVLVRERKNVILEFKKSLDRNLIYVEDFSRRLNGNHSCKVIHGDARQTGLKGNSVDFVFTSPPYAYAMDYARINQLNTLILFMNNEELKEHRKKYVGTDRVSDCFINNNGDYAGFEFARKAIEDVHNQNKRYGVCLYKYFSDMHKITKEIYRVLKPDSYLVYVVGNSTINRTKFYTDEVFKGMCKNVGFEIKLTLERKYYAYRLTRKRNAHSNTIKKDVFIVAKKN
ncbi:MAG: DNA methyltransferase [Candidatus Omnitrophica bacterium]|nr:DNA methyltransferase [Candidatus Omnitrophota bacterium]